MVSVRRPRVRGVPTSRGNRGYVLPMADHTDVFHPGQLVPTSGIYRCDGEDDHVFESTDVKGHRFPPLPSACRGGGWVLERGAAHH
jgi:hypothetical protein